MPKGVYKRDPNWHPWCYGLTKDTDPRLAKMVIKSSETRKLHPTIPWCKGLTKETDIRLANIGQAVSKALKGKHNSPETEYGGIRSPSFKGHNYGLCKKCGKDHGLNPMLGKKRPDLALRNKTPERRIASRLRFLGNTYGKALKGRKHTEEFKRKLSIAKLGKSTPKIKRDGYFGNHNWISRREPNKSEHKITEWIKEAGLSFQFTGNKIDEKLGISPDWTHIFKPYYIEFDGIFWHRDIDADLTRNQIYEENSCQLLILSDKDLKSKEDTIMKIKEFESHEVYY